MNSGKTRASLFAIVAVYLLHLAYELYGSRADADTTMTPAVRWLFIVFFALSAIGLIVFAVRVWRQSGEEEEKAPEENLPKE